jgi:hypothetical protein
VDPSPILKSSVPSSIPISPLARVGSYDIQFAGVSLRNWSWMNGISNKMEVIYIAVPQSNAGPKGYVLAAEPPSKTIAVYIT